MATRKKGDSDEQDDCPYVLVAKGRISGANIKAARIVGKALAVGLESHYLYNLD